MFENHPNELWLLSFVNLLERFGFYMLSGVLVLFIQVKFNYSSSKLGIVWGTFLLVAYITPLVGGIIADKTKKFKETCAAGLLLLFLGYLLLTFPIDSRKYLFVSLTIIAIGFGLFRGNLIVLLSDAYKARKFEGSKQSGFLIFYVAINMAAFYSPHAVVNLRDYKLSQNQEERFEYHEGIINASIKIVKGGQDQEALNYLASEISNTQLNKNDDPTAFCRKYLKYIANAYHFVFSAAAVAMLIAILCFWGLSRNPSPRPIEDLVHAESYMSHKEIRERLISIGIILFVVTFFWVSYNQSGYSFTLFAKDFTETELSRIKYLFFDFWGIHGLGLTIFGIYAIILGKDRNSRYLTGPGLVLLGSIILLVRVHDLPAEGNRVYPELFRMFNPFFVITLTPFIAALFKFSRSKDREPSTPVKVALGMLIASLAFLVLVLATYDMETIGTGKGILSLASGRVNVFWLVATYFFITVSELLLSPLGMAFVDEIAPIQYRGIMQGAWLTSGAIGGFLSGYIGYFYENWSLSYFFLLLSLFSILPAFTLFFLRKKLERFEVS